MDARHQESLLARKKVLLGGGGKNVAQNKGGPEPRKLNQKGRSSVLTAIIFFAGY